MPADVLKDGDYRIKAILSNKKDCPEIIRYEYFASQLERDKRYNHIMEMMKTPNAYTR